jgi:hypothetical protein
MACGLADSLSAQSRELDAEETKKLATNTTWIAPANNVHVFNSADGKRVLVRSTREPERGGVWWINNAGEFCSSIPTVRNGQQNCGKISDLGNNLYKGLGSEFRVEAGDKLGVGNR